MILVESPCDMKRMAVIRVLIQIVLSIDTQAGGVMVSPLRLKIVPFHRIDGCGRENQTRTSFKQSIHGAPHRIVVELGW
jgi:hypothetical protein